MGEPDTVELAATLLRERAHFLREGMPGAALGVDKNLHIHVQALIDLVTRLRSQGERAVLTRATAPVDDAGKQVRGPSAGGATESNPLTSRVEELEKALRDVYRLELVIESAVRWSDPGNLHHVSAMLKSIRALSSPPPSERG